jgi:adenylosuccinate lyase
MMIPRYETEEMKSIWDEAFRNTLFLKIEKAFTEEMVSRNLFPQQALEAFDGINAVHKKDLASIADFEKETRHDFLAFLRWLETRMNNPASSYLHLGLTSSDVQDTALMIQLRKSIFAFMDSIQNLKLSIKKCAYDNLGVLTIGRTHGMHAEPLPFSSKVSAWYSAIKRAENTLSFAGNHIAYGKMSGPVGNFAHFPMEVESAVLSRFNLRPEPVSTQIIPRDRIAIYGMACQNVCQGIEQIALEIRHLSRTEVGEVSEGFTSTQQGSSSMPHKKNPISSENLMGISRYVRNVVGALNEDVLLWHERDISHSSVERILLPDISHATQYSIERMAGVIRNLEVNRERIQANLNASTKHLSGQALVKISNRSRDESYRAVQKLALTSDNFKEDFENTYPDISLTYDRYLANEVEILDRVFNSF